MLGDIAGDATALGDSRASTCSELSVKSHVNATEDAATDLKTPLDSFPAVMTSELQLNKTETNSVKKPEDQNISSFMSAGTPVLNKNETFSSEMKTTEQLKAGEISKAVNSSQATLVSPVRPIYMLTYFHQCSRRIMWHLCVSFLLIAFVFVYSDCGGIFFNI